MSILDIEHVVFFRKDSDELKELSLVISNVKQISDAKVLGRIQIKGIDLFSIDKEVESDNLFNFIVLAFAGFRQVLRAHQKQNPDAKYFKKHGEKLHEQSIEDIFWVHDCAPG